MSDQNNTGDESIAELSSVAFQIEDLISLVTETAKSLDIIVSYPLIII